MPLASTLQSVSGFTFGLLRFPSAAVMAEYQDKSHPIASSPDVEEHMSIGRYIATRIPSLVPPMNPAPNPFKALTLLNRQQWLFFSVCSISSERTPD